MNKDNQPKGFRQAKQKAEELLIDQETAGYLLTEAEEKAQRNKSVLENIWEDLQSLIRLGRAWKAGTYREIPWQSIVFAIAGVIYFVNPFDLVPDFIPGAGYLDDATVIGFVVKSLKQDILRFLQWELSCGEGTSSGDSVKENPASPR